MGNRKLLGCAGVAVVAASLLGGCAWASKTHGPDGKEAYALNCSGLARSWATCLERAGDLCGERGYTVLERNGEVVNMSVGSGYANTSGASINSFSGTGLGRSMVVACKS